MIQSLENLVMDRRTDGRTDRRADRLTDESDFIGRCPTNVERLKNTMLNFFAPGGWDALKLKTVRCRKTSSQ